jgi:plasmid stabilization system protein ParE
MAKKQAEIKEFKVMMTRNAESDLDEIINFIAQNNPQTALKILDRIKARANTLNSNPARGAYVPELLAKNIKDYRQLTEPPWKIIYKIDKKVVYIMTIIDSRRNLQDILVRKLLK